MLHISDKKVQEKLTNKTVKKCLYFYDNKVLFIAPNKKILRIQLAIIVRIVITKFDSARKSSNATLHRLNGELDGRVLCTSKSTYFNSDKTVRLL